MSKSDNPDLDFFIDIYPDNPITTIEATFYNDCSDKRPSDIRVELSEFLVRGFGPEEAKQKAAKIKGWFANWPHKPLGEGMKRLIVLHIYFFMREQDRLLFHKKTSNLIKTIKSTPQWKHFEDLNQAQRSSPSPVWAKELSNYIDEYEKSYSYLSRAKLLDRSLETCGIRQLNKIKTSEVAQYFAIRLLRTLSLYCKKNKRHKEYGDSNLIAADKKLKELAKLFGIHLPKNLRKLPFKF